MIKLKNFTKSLAIDGPAGSGKSTVAKKVAEKLGFTYVDSGAIYRTCALYFIERFGPEAKVRITDGSVLSSELKKFDIGFMVSDSNFTVLLNGESVGNRIRTEEVSRFVPLVASNPPVRDKVNEKLRSFAATHPVVMDGRDIGTCVLPDSVLKVFLTAKAEVRAKRRFDELIAKGDSAVFEKVLEDVVSRDRMDETRAIAPLKMADDAVELDTSDMSAAEVIAKIVKMAEKSFNLK